MQRFNVDLTRLAPKLTQFDDGIDEVLERIDDAPEELAREMLRALARAGFDHGVWAASVEVKDQLNAQGHHANVVTATDHD